MVLPTQVGGDFCCRKDGWIDRRRRSNHFLYLLWWHSASALPPLFSASTPLASVFWAVHSSYGMVTSALLLLFSDPLASAFWAFHSSYVRLRPERAYTLAFACATWHSCVRAASPCFHFLSFLFLVYVRLRPERHTIWTWICVCATFCACWSSFFLFLITHCDLNYAIVVIILYFVFFINQSIITALLLCSWCILSHLYLNYDRKVSGLYTTNCWTMPCGILNVYPRHILCIKHRNCFFKKNSIFLVRLALFLGAYVKIFSLVLSFLKRNCFLSANSVNFSFLCCSFQAGMLTF